MRWPPRAQVTGSSSDGVTLWTAWSDICQVLVCLHEYDSWMNVTRYNFAHLNLTLKDVESAHVNNEGPACDCIGAFVDASTSEMHGLARPTQCCICIPAVQQAME